MDTYNPTNITSWITLFSVIAGFAYQAWRLERQRKWDLEDRRVLAERVITEATAVTSRVENRALKVEETLINRADLLAHKVEDTASTLASRDELNTVTVKVLEAIKENTEISTKAFEEANTVNKKIEKLGIAHNKIEQEKIDNKSADVIETLHDPKSSKKPEDNKKKDK